MNMRRTNISSIQNHRVTIEICRVTDIRSLFALWKNDFPREACDVADITSLRVRRERLSAVEFRELLKCSPDVQCLCYQGRAVICGFVQLDGGGKWVKQVHLAVSSGKGFPNIRFFSLASASTAANVTSQGGGEWECGATT